MNKVNHEKALRIHAELKVLGNAIGDLLREEGRLCDEMTTKRAVPHARVCSTLYDARDCVAAAIGYLQYAIGDVQGEQTEQVQEAKQSPKD